MITAWATPAPARVIATTITAAISEPTWGIRSNRPTIKASTTGNGAPMIRAVTPTTEPAMTEIASLQELLDHRLVLEVFDVARHVVHQLARLVQTGVAAQITSMETITKSEKKTSSTALPRPMPRRLSCVTSGSRPRAKTNAIPIVRKTSLATITM